MWFYYFRLFLGVLLSMFFNFSYTNTSEITGSMAFNFVGQPNPENHENQCPTNINETKVFKADGCLIQVNYMYRIVTFEKQYQWLLHRGDCLKQVTASTGSATKMDVFSITVWLE